MHPNEEVIVKNKIGNWFETGLIEHLYGACLDQLPAEKE